MRDDESRPAWGVTSKATALHGDALVWDNHTCLPLRPDAAFLPQLERFREAGVDAVTVNVMFDGIMSWHDGVKVLTFFRDWLVQRPELYVLVKTAEDITDAKASGRLAVLFDIEGMAALDGQLSLLRTYYDLGVRWMLIAYNRNNRAGGGCLDADTGLTPFGREVLGRAAELGMLICCSHTGERTCMEVFEYSSNPVILSHSNPKAMLDHPRNVSDEVMKACAATGGVVGTCGFGMFLRNGDTSAENLVRHIDYAVNLVGPDHVGLGLDFVFDEEELKTFLGKGGILGEEHPVPDMFAPEDMPALTEALLGMGYPETTIRGILGENWLRVARGVWKGNELLGV